jgi:hypothetical protein
MIQIKIKPIDIENIMDSLIKNPTFTFPTGDGTLARRVSRELGDLRRAKKLILAYDRRTGESVLVLKKRPNPNPMNLRYKRTELKMRGRRVQYDFEDDFFL